MYLTEPVLSVGDCGCSSSCTSSVLNQDADGYSVRARIDWVMANKGKSEQGACALVCGDEYPHICAKCDPSNNSQCQKSGGGGGGGSRCGCSSCSSSVLGRNAEGFSVESRIDWVKTNKGKSESDACDIVCGDEYPNICGECDPGRCGVGPSPTPPTPSPPTGGGGGGPVSVVTQNLYWWYLFNQHNGGNFYNVFRGYGPYDIFLFQECDDVSRVKNGLGYRNMQTFQSSHGLAVAWNGDRFIIRSQGYERVGEDKPGLWGERGVAYVRLEEKSTGKKIIAVSHHGPLPIDTGGQSGGRSVANSIVAVINGKKASGDVVILGGDFNANSGSETIRTIESLGYKRHANDWVDFIFTASGLSSSPQVTIIRGTGSDHRGIKTTWSSL